MRGYGCSIRSSETPGVLPVRLAFPCASNRCTFLAVAPDLKTERFMIRMDASERQMLSELADLDGVSEATVVRQLVRREHARRSTNERKPRKAKR